MAIWSDPGIFLSFVVIRFKWNVHRVVFHHLVEWLSHTSHDPNIYADSCILCVHLSSQPKRPVRINPSLLERKPLLHAASETIIRLRTHAILVTRNAKSTPQRKEKKKNIKKKTSWSCFKRENVFYGEEWQRYIMFAFFSVGAAFVTCDPSVSTQNVHAEIHSSKLKNKNSHIIIDYHNKKLNSFLDFPPNLWSVLKGSENYC